jgi:hypothetical protein
MPIRSVGILINERKSTQNISKYHYDNHSNTSSAATETKRAAQAFPVPNFDPEFVFLPVLVLGAGTGIVVLVLGVATDIGTNDPAMVLLAGDNALPTSSVWMIGFTVCREMRLEEAAGATVIGTASATALALALAVGVAAKVVFAWVIAGQRVVITDSILVTTIICVSEGGQLTAEMTQLVSK